MQHASPGFAFTPIPQQSHGYPQPGFSKICNCGLRRYLRRLRGLHLTLQFFWTYLIRRLHLQAEQYFLFVRFTLPHDAQRFFFRFLAIRCSLLVHQVVDGGASKTEAQQCLWIADTGILATTTALDAATTCLALRAVLTTTALWAATWSATITSLTCHMILL